MENIRIKFKFDTGWIDVSNKTKAHSFFTEKHLYKALNPVTDICRFKLKYDQSILSKLLLAKYDIEAILTKNGQPYFRGIVKPSYTMKSESRVEWVDIQLDDNGYKLDKTVNDDFVLQNIYLFNSDVVTSASENGTNRSLIHYILYKAGYDASSFSYPYIATHKGQPIVLSYFTHLRTEPNTDNKATSKIPFGGSYKELVSNILFQYGFTYYWDNAGRIRLFNYKDTNIMPSRVLDNTNMEGVFTLKKNEPTYDAVEISWYGKERLENQILFYDDDDTATETYSYGNINVQPLSYYPRTSNDSTMTDCYYNFTFEDGRSSEDVIAVENPVLQTQYYGYDYITTETWQEWVTTTTTEQIFGWKKVDSYTEYTWFPIEPSYVNGKTIRAHYEGYKCRGFLCHKAGYKWKINVYVWTVVDTKTINGGNWVTRSKEVANYASPVRSEEVQFLPLSFKLRIKNKSALYPMWIRLLRVMGDLVLRTQLNITRANYSPWTERMMKYKANYIYDENYADLLSMSLYNYFDQASFIYECESREAFDVGEWVFLTDNNFKNVDNFPVKDKRCLITSVKEEEFTGKKTYTLEQYNDYVG